MISTFPISTNLAEEHRMEATQTFCGLEHMAHDLCTACEAVHRRVGAEALQNTYETALAETLRIQGLPVQEQVWIPECHRGWVLNCGHVADLVVNQRVVVLVRALNEIGAEEEQMLLACLRLGGFPLGLIVNFHTAHAAFLDGDMRWLLYGTGCEHTEAREAV